MGVFIRLVMVIGKKAQHSEYRFWSFSCVGIFCHVVGYYQQKCILHIQNHLPSFLNFLCHIELTFKNTSFYNEADVIGLNFMLCACIIESIENTCLQKYFRNKLTFPFKVWIGNVTQKEKKKSSKKNYPSFDQSCYF